MLHGLLLIAFCVRDLEGIVEEIGIIDFPLTILASPVLMNVDVSGVWIVTYYLLGGSTLWYLVGRILDRWLAND